MYLTSQFETMTLEAVSSQMYLNHDILLLSLISRQPAHKPHLAWIQVTWWNSGCVLSL
jgi:hypothetical protein